MIAQAEMDEKDISKDGSCHCGAVSFRVRLRDGYKSIRRCNCSYCAMRGAIAVSVKLDDIEIVEGKDKLTLYQFNTRQAKHYFCSICGIYTHHQRRSNPNEYGVNVACLAGVSPFDFKEVPVSEGRQHPLDKGEKTSQLAGILRYDPV